jgi:transcription elongation factor GreA
MYITKQGFFDAQAELTYLTKVEIPLVVQQLIETHPSIRPAEATDYDYFKSKQAVIEKRIAELETLIRDAIIIKNVDTDKVSIGAKIKLEFLSERKVRTYFIVGTYEANPFENKISNEAPLIKAILNKKVNDTATVALKSRQCQIRVLEIST